MMNEFRTDDGSLRYRDEGAGTAVVLLHAGFLDHHQWDDQVPALARQYRVITPDARGHGASANATRPFRHADDLAALLRHLGTGPAVLAGVSMGAATAVDTALEHSEVVRALIVTGAGTSEPEFTDPWTLSLLQRQLAAIGAGDLDAAAEAAAGFAAGPRRTLNEVDPQVVGRIRTMARHTMAKHQQGERDWQRPVPDTWARAAGLTVPVLAVSGELDAADHVAMAERLAALAADGRTATIPGAGHFPNLERPDDYLRVLAGFLRTAAGTVASGDG
jgi:pimeloyl-ACP methyl ester carboxylesterase